VRELGTPVQDRHINDVRPPWIGARYTWVHGPAGTKKSKIL